jgi:DNA-3-methyladenine glycosylase
MERGVPRLTTPTKQEGVKGRPMQPATSAAGSAVPALTAAKAAKLPPLLRSFYDRDPRKVSRGLLGKLLLRRDGKSVLAARIVEVEAYLGRNDPAAHSFAGRTARNAVLWGPPGYSYVYFIYGNHYCFNVSCLPDGEAGGVLFRALEPLVGIAEMAQARGIEASNLADLRQLTSGPGRLAEAFGITRPRDNGKDLASTESDLWIADDGSTRPRVTVTARIGITKAAEKPLRFLVAGNPFVSGRKRL